MSVLQIRSHTDYDDTVHLVEDDSFLDSDDEDVSNDLQTLPYSSIPVQRLPFKDDNLKRLIPGCQIKIKIRDAYFKDGRCLFVVELEHGCFKWSVRRRIREFLQLHQHLHLYRTYLGFKLPEIKLEKDSNRRRSMFVVKNNKVPKIPSFPFNVEAVIKRKDIDWTMAAIENYVTNLLKIPCFRNYYETLEFFEIGPFSFMEDLGPKGKEGFVHGRSDVQNPILKCLCKACPFTRKRWMFLKENFIGLIHPRKGVVERVLLLDRAFATGAGKKKAGHENAIFIQTLYKKLYLKCESNFQQDDWMIEFNYYLDRGITDFVYPNRYDSFSPTRLRTQCKWIVDGATYFEAVAEALENAREEIFIASWWLTPEVYLKRPTVHGHYWQLDYVLKRKAREGVRIYVLLFKELEVALGINSYHTEKKLKRMHKNIKVIRHPGASKGVLLWAHHEKIVCVDQTYAFVGGLDLCYGRWDDFQHRLSDFGAAEDELKVFRHLSVAPSFSTEKSVSRKTSSLPSESSLSSVEIQLPSQEETAPEPSQNTKGLRVATRKLQARKMFEGIRKQLSMELKPSTAGELDVSSCPVQAADQNRLLQEMTLKVLGIDHKFRLWIGKDYANFISRDFENLHEPYSDMIDRERTPRMPWHDVGIFLQGRAARDVARHFILRWNHSKAELIPDDISTPLLMPKAYENFGDNIPSIVKDTVGKIYRAECQVLRSLSFWSGRITETESSIHNAYIDVIRDAKHFIYIENQFFITQPGSDTDVHNGIADALYNRIIRAHRNQETFRVYVILPLLPAFEGELGTGSGTLIQAITHWNYKSICRGPTSLYQRLSRRMKDPTFYISFYGLRTHGVLKNKLVTELVYVHSKLLIADDNVAIIGSANINDRSLLGRRDSEIAVVVRDTQFVDKEEGIPHQAGIFCYSLRTALFKEHLGLMFNTDLQIDFRDPAGDEFFAEVWTKTALKNSEIYEEVFRCIPSDYIRNFLQLAEHRSTPVLASTNVAEAKRKLRQIRGYLVIFPFSFLCEERLEPQISTKEHFLPNCVWT